MQASIRGFEVGGREIGGNCVDGGGIMILSARLRKEARRQVWLPPVVEGAKFARTGIGLDVRGEAEE